MSVHRDGPVRRLIGSVRLSSALLVELLRTRLALVSVEFERELLRMRSMALLLAAGLLCLGLAMALAVLFVIVLFWDTHRLLAIGASCAVLLLACVGLVAASRLGMSRRPALFSATLHELAEDARTLRGETRQ